MGWATKFLEPVLKVGAGVLLGEGAATLVGSFFGDDEPAKQIEKAATVAVAGTDKAGITVKPGALAAVRASAERSAATGMPSALIPVQAGGGLPIAGTKNIVMTIVETRNARGELIRKETLKGAPFLMKTDITAAKRVFKKSMKLQGKLPRRTVKQSQSSQLKELVLDKAMAQIMGPSCPPKC